MAGILEQVNAGGNIHSALTEASAYHVVEGASRILDETTVKSDTNNKGENVPASENIAGQLRQAKQDLAQKEQEIFELHAHAEREKKRAFEAQRLRSQVLKKHAIADHKARLMAEAKVRFLNAYSTPRNPLTLLYLGGFGYSTRVFIQ